MMRAAWGYAPGFCQSIGGSHHASGHPSVLSCPIDPPPRPIPLLFVPTELCAMQIYNGGRSGSFRIVARSPADSLSGADEEQQDSFELPPSRGGISISLSDGPPLPSPTTLSQRAGKAHPRFREIEWDD